MSIISVSSATSQSVKSSIRRHGSGGNMCVHGIQPNIGPNLPDDSPNPTARISFASDTNFTSKPKSRKTSKTKTTAINIRPIKVGEHQHVTKFQVPKATVPSFVNPHISADKADLVEPVDSSYFWDYTKTPHYLHRSGSNVSDGNRFSDGSLYQGQGDPLYGHGMVQGHGGTLTRNYGPHSDRTHAKHDLSLGIKIDGLRMLRTQPRLPSMTSDRVSINKASYWMRPSNESSFQHLLPVFSHLRESHPNFGQGRSFHFNNEETLKRLKFKCKDCGKFRTNIDNLRWVGKQECVCRYYHCSLRVDKKSTDTNSEMKMDDFET